MTHCCKMYSTANLAFVAGLMALTPSLSIAQAPRCSILKGTYAVTFSGTVVQGANTTPVPFAGVGVSTFDGAGKTTSIQSADFNGFIVRSQAFSGTYTLKPDCTGTMITTYANGVVGTQDFVVANGGKAIYAIGVDGLGQLLITYTRMQKS